MSQNQDGLRSGTGYIHTSRHLHANFMSQLRQPSVVFLSRKLSISSFPELLHHNRPIGTHVHAQVTVRWQDSHSPFSRLPAKSSFPVRHFLVLGPR